MSEKKLYLIDGNSLLYRSYYALRNLTTSKGFPTNAIYGFLTTLRKIIDKDKPGWLGIVFDAPGRKLRHDVYEEYKAHRKPMPEDLVVQIPKLKEVIETLRIPVFVHPGYEADDVLGTLARKAKAGGFTTVIVTTDKDLLQLVDKATFVYNPSKETLLDEDKVREFFGGRPSQVADILALMGDPSDNVPGVPGIGEKTAKALIEEFGSLDRILEDPGRIRNPKVRDKLVHNLDKLEMSRKLVALETGLDVDFDPDRFVLGEPDRDAAARIFEELEFTSLVKEYHAGSPSAAAAAAERAYTAIFEESELRALAARIRKAGEVSVDTETTDIFPTRARLVGMSFAIKPCEAFYLPLRHDYLGAPQQIPVEKAFGILRGVLEDPAVRKVGQNIKYDAIVLAREGIRLRGIDLDTMILSYLVEPNWGQHNLDKLATAYLHLPAIPYNEIVGRGKAEIKMNQAPIDKVTPYAAQDADYALEVSRILWPRVEAEKLAPLYRQIEQPLIEVLADMETIGVKVDGGALRSLSAELEAGLRRLEKKIYEAAGKDFNINSPQQLGDVLFHKLQLPVSRKTRATKGFSTAVDVLEELAPLHPMVGLVLEFRKTTKLKSTYADALFELIDPETGRIHTSYNQAVASTGRLSSSDPNLQNIPAREETGRRIRQAFVPEEGCLFLGADYSQIELRVLAHMSGDPTLIETFAEDRDVHEETARRVFGEGSSLFKDEQRRRAKVINFSVIYGTSAFSLAKELQTSNAEAQAFIDTYYAKYPKVKEFLDRIVEDAARTGYSETLFGRRRPVPELRQADRNAQQAGRRIALNTPLQGTAADLMKKAMIDIWLALRKKNLKTRMILQVHDELVFEVPEGERKAAEKLVRDKMGSVCDFKVPLKVHLGWGKTWADAK